MTTFQVPFRMIAMRCCGTVLCYVNSRLPNYCSECGEHVIKEVRTWVAVDAPDARITYKRARTSQHGTGNNQ